MAGGISIHAVDIAFGCPAAGLRLELRRADGGQLLHDAFTDIAGKISAPNHDRGRFLAVFHIGDYLRAKGYEGKIFQEAVSFPFGIDQPERHHHLPLKFTPFGMSLFLTH